jgi:tetratricopeptide (TPR) repeat protein
MIKVNDEETKSPMAPVQLMEIITLKVKSLIATDKFAEALALMTDKKKWFIDTLQRETLLAEINEKLGNKDQALEHLDELLQMNSQNYDTYYQVLRVKGIKLFNEHGKPLALQADDKAKVKESFEYY